MITLLISLILFKITQSSNFYYEQTPKTWVEANDYCLKTYGSSLALLKTDSDIADALTLVGTESVWIGATDASNDGNYRWLDGNEFNNIDNNRFDTNEPNNANHGYCPSKGEDCVELWKGNGKFNDQPCNCPGFTRKFLCNKVPAVAACPCFNKETIESESEYCSSQCCGGQLVRTETSEYLIDIENNKCQSRGKDRSIDGLVFSNLPDELFGNCQEILAPIENSAKKTCTITESTEDGRNIFSSIQATFIEIGDIINGKQGKSLQLIYIIFLFMIISTILFMLYCCYKKIRTLNIFNKNDDYQNILNYASSTSQTSQI